MKVYKFRDDCVSRYRPTVSAMCWFCLEKNIIHDQGLGAKQYEYNAVESGCMQYLSLSATGWQLVSLCHATTPHSSPSTVLSLHSCAEVRHSRSPVLHELPRGWSRRSRTGCCVRLEMTWNGFLHSRSMNPSNVVSSRSFLFPRLSYTHCVIHIPFPRMHRKR